jgi:predicted transcriptional regulator
MDGNDGVRLRSVDKEILEQLMDGRYKDQPWGILSPGLIGNSIDFTSQHIINRLQVLQASGYVEKVDRGIYQITKQGIGVFE